MTDFAAAVFILDVLRGYALVGAAVAVAFLMFGIDRYDPVARSAYVFRALLVPGLVLLWPLVLVRWRSLEAARRRGG